MPIKNKKPDKGASKKKTKSASVVLPDLNIEEEEKCDRSINIGMPVNEKTLRELKENARKL